MKRITTSCLINSYNYVDFILEAIDSALKQTINFDEIIIVDDFSTDNTVDIIQSTYQREERVKIIAKNSNEGQLAAINTGFTESNGELICFLDADDKYRSTYLENILHFYKEYPSCDCLFTDLEEFTDSGKFCIEHESHSYSKTVSKYAKHLGYRVIVNYHLQTFQGVQTSGISFKREALSYILPMPYVKDWRVRADDCLVHGAALAKLERYRFKKKLVGYRIHGSNNFSRRPEAQKHHQNYLYEYNRKMALERFYQLMVQRMNYNPEHFPLIAVEEFKIMPNNNYFRFYFGLILWSRFGLCTKVKLLYSITSHLIKNKMK